MPPDSAAIDAALIQLLLNDSALHALMPDGVFYDIAATGLKRFVIVSLILEQDFATFGGRAYEDALYLIKAVELSSSGANVNRAADRINQLLEDQPLSAPGYGLMTMHREERIRFTDVDEIDKSIRWQHHGGRYRIQMALT